MNIRTLTFDLLITNKCNFKCSYCIEAEYTCFHTDPFYNDIKHYTKEEIYNFIDRMLESKFFNTNYNVLDIHLWGGEPTLDTDFIIDIVNHYINNNNVIFMISTNGYKIGRLLNFIQEPRIQNKIVQGLNYFMLQISYDGKIINDLKRLHANGDIVTNDVITTIKYARSNNIIHGIKSTITFDTLQYIYEAYDDIINNLHEYSYFPTLDYRHEEISKLSENNINDYLSILKHGMFKIAKNEINYIKSTGRSRFEWFNPNRAECSANKDMFAIDTNGKIYACHGCLNVPSKNNHYIGHINDNNIIDLISGKNMCYKENYHIVNDICSDCDAIYCLKCNATKYELSDKDGYYERWFDYKIQPCLCKLYKFISNISRAVNTKVNN